MSASGTPASVTPADPSMEDILASIRRILSEDETAPPAPAPAVGGVLLLDDSMLVTPAATPAGPAAAGPAMAEVPVQARIQSIESDLAHMILAEKGGHETAAKAEAALEPPPTLHPPSQVPGSQVPGSQVPASQMSDPNMADLMSSHSQQHVSPDYGATEAGLPNGAAPPYGPLVAPEPAAATQSAVSAMMRHLSTERTTPVYRGGPSLEDLVREEMRPILKHWLDTHLPPMVERLVRGELDRLIARAAP